MTPHVIEPSFGIDRSIYTVLEHAYDEDTIDGERRVVLRLSPHIAPVEVAVFPLVKALNEKALEVFRLLRRAGLLVEYRRFRHDSGDGIEDKTRSEHRSPLLSITKLLKIRR